MSQSDAMEEDDFEGSDCDEQIDDQEDVEDQEENDDSFISLRSGSAGNQETNALGGESLDGENSNSQSSFSSGQLEELETDKQSNGNRASAPDGSFDNSDSKSNKSRDDSLNSEINKHNESKVVANDSKENNDSNSRSDSGNSEDSQSSVNGETSNGKGDIRKTPNLNECTGKPASMWKLVNGTNNDGSSKEEDEDEDSESDSIPETQDKSPTTEIGRKVQNQKAEEISIAGVVSEEKEKNGKVEPEVKDKNDEAKDKNDEDKDKNDEDKAKNDEAKAKKDEAKAKNDEAKDKNDEAKNKNDEAKNKNDEAKNKNDEAKNKNDEAKNKNDEAKDKNDEAKDKNDEAKDKNDEAKDKNDEAKDKNDEAKDKKDEAKDKKDEAKDKKDEAKDKKDEAKEISSDDKAKSETENTAPAVIETRRRSLRNAAKKAEIEIKTPPKADKRKSSESPRSREKKLVKVAEPKEPPKPVEPTTVPMSQEILEEAKFPQFLKETITLGCYVPISDKNTGNIKLKEGESLLETPSISMPLLLKKPDLINKSVEIKTQPKDEANKKNYYQIKPFFNSSVGEFLIGIGLSRVNEWYEKDMMKLKQRQLKRDSKNEDLESSLQDHTTSYMRSKQANDPFNFNFKKCSMCDFKTESELVLQGHLLVPHMTPRREFMCNFCTFITRDHKVILFHMEALHNKKGVLELPGQFFYDCPYCPFETNLKTRATSHTNKCMKYFLSTRNQLPPGDWENPTITAKPITLADIKSYEMCVAAASAVARSNVQKPVQRIGVKPIQQPQRIIRPAPSSLRTNAPQSSLSLYQQIVTASLKDSGHFSNNVQKNRFTGTITKTLPGKPEITVAVPGGQLYQVVNNGQVVPIIGHGGTSQFLIPAQSSNSSTPQPVALFPNLAASGSGGSKNSISVIPQSISVTKRLPASTSLIPTATLSPAVLNKMQQQNLPKLQGPYTTVQTASKSAYGNPMLPNTTFVICEICDGYLKDLEQLRTHMLWIHKVKIHPKMLSSRPPLNCQKCQWRFFTDQGLERHLLGAHGLVTSNMQELANKNQDGGRCTVCGRVYVCKLVSHMNQVHKATLKPAHLSYKCTVCSATFNLYKLFENHVYMFHSGSVKRSGGDEAGNAKKKLAANSAVEMTVVPAKKNDLSVKVTVTPTPAGRALPPPMKLPAVEPIPSVTITPTNVVPEKSNPINRLKKNSVDVESAEKTITNLIKKPHFNDIIRCRYCSVLVRNISVHMKLRHTKKCKVKACCILKCEKCLGSFDGMVVLHTADFEENSDSESVDETLPKESV